ncbi:hypothetical protein PsorP6_000798 [Peronosclerospora sorghi]|uniref:Uncharacterized protein n=1 Tax=Peronosclerospora sorghi TaxID=230839 RepID=A0ACC0WRY3_9STRA|nr:hypothetical protein PsorP6_000798 [Peronosclerospora sorghi]
MSGKIASDDPASNVFLETASGKGRRNIIENKWNQRFAMITMCSDKILQSQQTTVAGLPQHGQQSFNSHVLSFLALRLLCFVTSPSHLAQLKRQPVVVSATPSDAELVGCNRIEADHLIIFKIAMNGSQNIPIIDESEIASFPTNHNSYFDVPESCAEFNCGGGSCGGRYTVPQKQHEETLSRTDSTSLASGASNTRAWYPVVVFFLSGGAWIIGYKAWGALMGRVLESLGVVVVTPDYRNFPQGVVPDMMKT